MLNCQVWRLFPVSLSWRRCPGQVVVIVVMLFSLVVVMVVPGLTPFISFPVVSGYHRLPKVVL